ncbi:hypothetical protein JCM21900_001633 [Sporobolomyces salmonicolor]
MLRPISTTSSSRALILSRAAPRPAGTLGATLASRTAFASRTAQLSSRRAYATAPTKSSVLPNPALSTPPKPRKSLTRRILTPLALLTIAFYGASLPLGYLSLRYRDFLVETVPLGEKLGELLDEFELSQTKSEGAPAPGQAVPAGKETELTRYAETKAKAEGWAVKKGSRADPEKVAGEIKSKLEAEAKKAKEAAQDKVAGAVEAAKARASELKQAVTKAPAVIEDKAHQIGTAVKELKVEAVSPAASQEKVAEPAALAEPASTLPVYAQKPRQLDATPIPAKRADKEVYQGPPLPLGFEPAPGYELPRPPPTPKGDIKPVAPPPAPLPLVAPALKDVTTSEPVLGQLASTIDSLAKYVEKNDANTSEGATAVLSSAQKDIKGLAARLEAIKQQEEAKLQQQLKEQANKYSGMLLNAEKELVERLDTQEEDWKKAFDMERQKLVAAYKDKLEHELATQQEIINQRLKEEVVAQGIELQRRWVQEIKMRVEQERGGRLAKLEELESGVRKLEKVAKENEEVVGEAVRARKIFAAVKALEHAVESGAPFATELAAVQRLAAAPPTSSSSTSDSLIALALKTVPAEVASTGIASFPALAARFHDSVAPQLKKVSLLPEHGGLMAYLTSVVMSHVLFEKEGWADGDDVVSTVARARFWLANKDLDLATREVNSLKGWPKALAADWLKQARNHLEVKQALEIAEREATAESIKAI